MGAEPTCRSAVVSTDRGSHHSRSAPVGYVDVDGLDFAHFGGERPLPGFGEAGPASSTAGAVQVTVSPSKECGALALVRRP